MNKLNPTLADLYPDLGETELNQVKENLARYAELVARIFQRLEAEHEGCSDAPLTGPDGTL